MIERAAGQVGTLVIFVSTEFRTASVWGAPGPIGHGFWFSGCWSRLGMAWCHRGQVVPQWAAFESGDPGRGRVPDRSDPAGCRGGYGAQRTGERVAQHRHAGHPVGALEHFQGRGPAVPLVSVEYRGGGLPG